MRCIGHIEDAEHAHRFGDYLLVNGIENTIEEESDGWAVWVHSEDEIDDASGSLEAFRKSPEAPAFRDVGSEANARRRSLEREEREARERMIEGSQLWPEPVRGQTPPLTLLLIAISILVTAWYHLGPDRSPLRVLFISSYVATRGGWWHGLVEVSQGQVWRLVTPIFLHFGILHILFNMLWLRDLGSMIEARRGTLLFGLFVLVVAVLSNLTQYALSGPNFGGMSGVVYGLLGYAWMKSRYQATAGIRLHRSTVTMMIVWFFLCLSGLVGSIANGAHAGGLIAGIVWGYIESGELKRQWRRRTGSNAQPSD
jgi:GlpG protein